MQTDAGFILLDQTVATMYFIWVDESGSPRINPQFNDNGYYILCGVIVREENWREIEDGISTIKKGVFPELNPQDWELHAFDMWNGAGLFQPGKSPLSLEKKRAVFSQVFEFVSKSEITLLCTIIFKDRLREKYTTPQPLKYSWTFLAERFEHFLAQKQTGTNNGLFAIDAIQNNIESQIRGVIGSMSRNGGNYPPADHVIGYPIFVKSHIHNMIQVADMIAYAVHRYYKGDSQFKDWFEKLKPKMYRPGGRLRGYGLKEFPIVSSRG